MTWQDRGELRADPGIAPGSRNIDPPRRRSIWPSIAVAAAAAAFGGVIWFAYQTGKTGNGGVPPLVKAETGPIKVKPDNPGGAEIPFQDSTVYDRLDQNGQKPVVEKLLPENETPVTRPQPAPAPPPSADATALAPPPGEAPVALPGGSGVVVAPQAQPQEPSPSSQETALAPQSTVLAPAPPPPQQIVQAPPPTPPAVKPQAAVKPPAAKPAADSIAALIGASEAKVAAPPRPVAGGAGYRLQLSAVRTPDAVSAEWSRLKHRFPELAPLRNSSSKIDVPGKGTFYRVEAGPLAEGDAKSTCAHLRAQGLGCIVVKP